MDYFENTPLLNFIHNEAVANVDYSKHTTSEDDGERSHLLLALFGYAVMTIVYCIFVVYNIQSGKPEILLGSILIFLGYVLLAYKYVQEVSEKDEELEKEKKAHKAGKIGKTHTGGKAGTSKKAQKAEREKKQEKQAEIRSLSDIFLNGYFVVFLFYLLSFLLPINPHSKLSNITAVIGYFLLFINHFVIVGYASLLAYYGLYFFRHIKDINTSIVSVLQTIASGSLIVYYSQDILSHLHIL